MRPRSGDRLLAQLEVVVGCEAGSDQLVDGGLHAVADTGQNAENGGAQPGEALLDRLEPSTHPARTLIRQFALTGPEARHAGARTMRPMRADCRTFARIPMPHAGLSPKRIASPGTGDCEANSVSELRQQFGTRCALADFLGISPFPHSCSRLCPVVITHACYFDGIYVALLPGETHRSCVFPLPVTAAWTP